VVTVAETTREKMTLEGSEINGRYVLGKKLGEGGMGVVYKARQLSTHRDVALKILKINATDQTSVDRFEREIDVISQLSHPNIVRIYDTGKLPSRDMLFIVMELVEGLSLHELMWHRHDENKYFKCRLKVELALEVAYQVCGALTEPHRLGVIHRDIKPENILLTPRSDETVEVKLLDFGIARMTRRRGSNKKVNTITDASIPFVGTPHYMAPEQVANTEYDARADLYSLGTVLYELLCASYPFDEENLFALLLRKTQYDPEPLAERIRGEFPFPEVAELVMSLLSRDPDGRPQSAIKVRRRIEAIQDHYRMRRVRVDGAPFFTAQHERDLNPEILDVLSDDERLEPGRAVFRPWLLYPSGRPLLAESTENDTVPEGHVALADRLSKEPSEVETIEEGQPPKPSSPEAPVRDEPVRHTMQSWSVSAEWTNSFKVGELQRGVEEMLELFEGPVDEDGEAEDDEAVTNMWKPDLSDMPAELRAQLGDRFGEDQAVDQRVDVSSLDLDALKRKKTPDSDGEKEETDRSTMAAFNPAKAFAEAGLEPSPVEVAMGATLDDWRGGARAFDDAQTQDAPEPPRESNSLLGQTHSSGSFQIGPVAQSDEDEPYDPPTELTPNPFALAGFKAEDVTGDFHQIVDRKNTPTASIGSLDQLDMNAVDDTHLDLAPLKLPDEDKNYFTPTQTPISSRLAKASQPQPVEDAPQTTAAPSREPTLLAQPKAPPKAGVPTWAIALSVVIILIACGIAFALVQGAISF
jgi:serine/threonine protein kinase